MLSERPFVFAAGLCLICSFMLTFAASSLKPMQLKNQMVDKQKNILKVLKITDSQTKYTNNEIENLYSTYIQTKWISESGSVVDEPTDAPIFLYVKDGQVDAYAIPISGYGLWSTLYGYFSVNGDGTTVRGITFYEHGETPGLGAEVEAKWFQDNFIGKKIASASGEFKSVGIVKGKVENTIARESDRQYYVDGISGATVTSNGVNEFLKEALLRYELFAKKLRAKENVI
jgi:Na+-transporting NADH:ubiquinone oxidoreductase subunit C